MTDIALLMTGVLTTGQLSPPIAPELPLVQQDNEEEKSTQGRLSQTVSTAQITPPEFMQSERTAWVAASAITIENDSILNPTEINILSEIPYVPGSENFRLVGKDRTKDVIAKPEMLLSFDAIPKMRAELGNTVRNFQRRPLKESKKILLASTYFVKFQVASDDSSVLVPRQGNRYQMLPQTSVSQSLSLPALRFGNSGVTVRVLQKLLLSNGYNIRVDGVFGALTEAAVKAFQNQRNLRVDGVVGQRTWYELTK